jgi:hypothetical protein
MIFKLGANDLTGLAYDPECHSIGNASNSPDNWKRKEKKEEPSSERAFKGLSLSR